MASRELAIPAPAGTAKTYGRFSPDMIARLGAWRITPSVITAAELLEAAIVEGHEGEAIHVAEALTDSNFTPTPSLKEQAARFLEKVRGDGCSIDGDLSTNPRRLRFWRLRTRSNPVDALAWVELARLQLVLGLTDAARKSMTVARALAPLDRHVLRSAVRMEVHLADDEAAHRLLKKSPATPHDPWLTAAEVAVATRREKTSQFFKAGQALLDSGDWPPRQTSELAAALGTTVIIDGKHKRGLKLLKQGLADPTGNTLAQAEWITTAFNDPLLVSSALKNANDAHEARTLRFLRTGLFAKALESAIAWLDEEPFSGRAHGSAVAAACLQEDYPRTLTLVEEALKYAPKIGSILHNKAYALACSGKLDEAEVLLDVIDNDEPGLDHIAVANRGLIRFRRGNLEDGVKLYKDAIAGFKKDGALEPDQVAHAFLAREAIRAAHPKAKDFFKEAEKALAIRDSAHARKVLGDAKMLAGQKKIHL